MGAGGVANEASIASFTCAHFNSSTGTITYRPEQIPPQGWYRSGYPMFLSQGLGGNIALYIGAAATLDQPLLFGANTGNPGAFTGEFSLSQSGGSGSCGGTTVNGVVCAIEESVDGNFISEAAAVQVEPAAERSRSVRARDEHLW